MNPHVVEESQEEEEHEELKDPEVEGEENYRLDAVEENQEGGEDGEMKDLEGQ